MRPRWNNEKNQQRKTECVVKLFYEIVRKEKITFAHGSIKLNYFKLRSWKTVGLAHFSFLSFLCFASAACNFRNGKNIKCGERKFTASFSGCNYFSSRFPSIRVHPSSNFCVFLSLRVQLPHHFSYNYFIIFQRKKVHIHTFLFFSQTLSQRGAAPRLSISSIE